MVPNFTYPKIESNILKLNYVNKIIFKIFFERDKTKKITIPSEALFVIL